MKNFNPKVSIVIPVYNGSNYLKQAIDSALAQTYKNIEIIIVNDGSNDNNATEKIAKSYGDKIRYFKKENGGVATALNLGIKKMKGEYFSWLSHDDMYKKEKIKAQLDILSLENNKAQVVASNIEVLYADGRTEETYMDEALFNYFDIFLAIDGKVGLNGCSLLIPKEALDVTQGFNVGLTVTQDYDLWFRINKNFKFIFTDKVLVTSRRHKLQDSVKKQKLCFNASDKMHYDFLNEISQKEFFDCIDDNGLNKILDYYNIYKQAGYIKTSSAILKKILHYSSKRNAKDSISLFSSEIGHFSDLELINNKKSKKRIMFFSNVWHMGGIERVLSSIFANLNKEYDIFLVTIFDSKDNSAGYELPDKIFHIRINNRAQHNELLNIISLFDIDIFVGNPNFMESFLGIYQKLKDVNVKSIAYNHGYYFLPYMYEYLYPTALKIKRAYSDADAVVWLTRVGCSIYSEINKNGVLISNPVKVDPKIEPKKTIAKKILAVGRYDDSIKQIDKVIEVFSEILKIDQDYKLDVVGYCPLDIQTERFGSQTLSEYIKKLNIPRSKIIFHGQQSNVTDFYKKSDFLLLTSTCEGFPLVLVEAMSNGVPCACFDYLGIEDIVENGINGFVVPQDDCKGLAAQITTVIKDKKAYYVMSKRCLDLIKRYDEPLFIEKWINLIESILSGEANFSSCLQAKLDLEDSKKVIHEYAKFLDSTVSNYQTLKEINNKLRTENADFKLLDICRIFCRRLINRALRVRSIFVSVLRKINSEGFVPTLRLIKDKSKRRK